MPFSKSPLYFGVLLIMSGFAFYPLYLMDLPNAPMSRHLHAVFGTLWLLILIVQPLLVHCNRKNWHRRLGIFAILCGIGFIVSLWASLTHVVSSEQPYFVRYSEQVSFLLVLTAVLFTFLFLSAIRYRHQEHLHARYMIASGLLMLEPILERIFGFWIPGLMTSLDDVPFVWFLSYTCMLAVCALLIWKEKGSTRLAFPFWLVAISVLLRLIVLGNFTTGTVWTSVFNYIGSLSVTTILLVSVLVNGALVVVSWLYPAPESEKIA